MLKILATTALAAMLVLDLGGASPAFALTILYKKLVTGDTQATSYNDDGEKVAVHTYDENNKLINAFYYNLKEDPNPEGGDSGLVDTKAAIEDAMKNGGAETVKENHFLQTTLGQTLIKHSNTGSIIPFHNPVPIDSSVNPGTGASNPVSNGLSEDPFADKNFEREKNPGSMGGDWYDPMGGSMVEQMIKAGKKNKGKDNKGSGDAASDARNPGYDFSADPALVNPVPINLPVAKPGKKKVQHVSAPALVKKSKKRLRNTSKYYPTIPNMPSPAMTNNSPSRRNGVLRKRQRGASGNFRTMQGLGSMRRKARRHSFSVQHSNRIKVPTSRNRLR